MAVALVFETHAITVDNEIGVATDHLLLGLPLAPLVAAGPKWQGGWEYIVPTGWRQPN